MAAKSTIKTAEQLLDRFFRDAEGRTNRQIDVYFALEDMDVPRDKAEPALDYLKSRGLVNLFGNDIGFLTDKGVEAMVEELDIGQMDKEVRDFIQKPVAASSAPEPKPAAPSKPQGSPRPARAQLTHIDLEGGEFTLSLGMRCRIGRSEDNEVRISDKRASKHHAEIIYSNGRYVLVDEGSANGTLLNGDYVVEPVPLKHDDEIVIGRTMLLYQAPKVVPAPTPEPQPAEEEPGTVITSTQAQAPTERPASAPAADDSSGPIRVVKGTPVRDTPEASSPADLFAEPPTAAPSSDLFAEPPAARPASGGDLFADEPPTQIPPEPAAPEGDLFGDGPTPSSPDDDLFSEGPRGGAPAEARDDLFSDGPSGPTAAPGEGERDAGGDFGLDLEPLAGAPELAQAPAEAHPVEPLDPPDTVAAAPADAPEVDDLWSGDVTPTSEAPSLLDNAPVQLEDEVDTVDTPPETGDAATLMMERSDLLERPSAPEPELPRWSEATRGDDTPAPYAGADASLDAATEALDGEALPDATPSLAMSALDSGPQEDAGATMDAEPAHPEFFLLLARLKAEVRRASVPEQARLVDAIEVLESHPYVRLVLGKI